VFLVTLLLSSVAWTEKPAIDSGSDPGIEMGSRIESLFSPSYPQANGLRPENNLRSVPVPLVDIHAGAAERLLDVSPVFCRILVYPATPCVNQPVSFVVEASSTFSLNISLNSVAMFACVSSCTRPLSLSGTYSISCSISNQVVNTSSFGVVDSLYDSCGVCGGPGGCDSESLYLRNLTS
jgi:hypothetical protein